MKTITDARKDRVSDFSPAEAFPPGEYLRDELDERGWSQVEFAQILGRPVRTINQILNGKRAITPETAKELSAALGTSAEFWLNLETAYRLKLAEPASARIARRAQLRERAPIREMLNRRWLEPSDNVDVLEAQVLRFFGTSSLEERSSLAHAAKRTRYDEPLGPAQEAWITRVRQLAEAVPVAPYSPERLREAVTELRELLALPEHVGRVPAVLGAAGVRFLIVEQLPSLKVDGVCLWFDDLRPVIGMSLRFDRIDNFWFVLRHEIEHVLRRDGTVLDTEIESEDPDAPDSERIANDAAADFCVPVEELADFMIRAGPVYTDTQIRGFAARIGVHPGLVAGQLRRRLARWDLFQRHLVKIREHLLPHAVVDGFGHMALVEA